MSEYREVGNINQVEVTDFDHDHTMKGVEHEAFFKTVARLLPKWLNKTMPAYDAYVESDGTIYQLVDTDKPILDEPSYDGAKGTLLDDLFGEFIPHEGICAEADFMLNGCANFVKYANSYLNWYGYEMLDDTYTIRRLKGKEESEDFLKWEKFMKYMEQWEPKTEGDELIYDCFSRNESDYACYC